MDLKYNLCVYTISGIIIGLLFYYLLNYYHRAAFFISICIIFTISMLTHFTETLLLGVISLAYLLYLLFIIMVLISSYNFKSKLGLILLALPLLVLTPWVAIFQISSTLYKGLFILIPITPLLIFYIINQIKIKSWKNLIIHKNQTTSIILIIMPVIIFVGYIINNKISTLDLLHLPLYTEYMANSDSWVDSDGEKLHTIIGTSFRILYVIGIPLWTYSCIYLIHKLIQKNNTQHPLFYYSAFLLNTSVLIFIFTLIYNI